MSISIEKRVELFNAPASAKKHIQLMKQAEF